jgi:hypothetical protein
LYAVLISHACYMPHPSHSTSFTPIQIFSYLIYDLNNSKASIRFHLVFIRKYPFTCHKMWSN